MFRKKNPQFCGCDHEMMEITVEKLLDIKNSVGLSQEEDYAMHIAIQAVCRLMNAMTQGGKVEWDG